MKVTSRNLGPNLKKLASFQNSYKISADIEKNHFGQKRLPFCQYLIFFWSSFFTNNFILILFKDFEMKNEVHSNSFFLGAIFRGSLGVPPPNFSKNYFYKKLPINNIEKVKNF